MNAYYHALKEKIEAVDIVDTHEHQVEEKDRLGMELDFGVLINVYANCTLMSAGMQLHDMEFIIGEGNDPAEKWKRLKPFWEAVRHTDYMRAYLLSMKAAYGIGELNEENCKQLSCRIKEGNKPGIVKRLVKETAGVERCIVNAVKEDEIFRTETDTEIFDQEIGFGILFSPDKFPKETLPSQTGISLNSMSDLCKSIDWYLEQFSERAVSIKIQSAYSRPLFFDQPDSENADKAFSRFLSDPDSVSSGEIFTFQNYMMHHIIQRSIDFQLPLRLHTGYLTGWDYMELPTVNPVLLTNILKKYPEARFSLFHIGYPYQDEMAAMVKHFSNVYADMCWSWIVDYEASRGFLKQALHAAPCSKIFGFGGDYLMADNIAGHAMIARQGIATVLSEMHEEGFLTEKDAEKLAIMLLRENAIRFFGLEEKSA